MTVSQFAPALELLVATVFPALVIVAALRDTTTMTIPNWLCAAGALAFLPVALASGMTLATTGIGVAVGFAVLVAGIGMFAAQWIGGGDAKLLAVCSMWLGWQQLLPFALWTAIAGGGLAVFLLWARKIAVHIPSQRPDWVQTLLKPGGDVPYGIAIALGALVTFPDSPVMTTLQNAIRI